MVNQQKALMGTADLNLLREKAIKRKKVNNLLKQILIYSIFLSFLFVMAFSNNDQNSFYYQTQLRKLFAITNDDTSSLISVFYFKIFFVNLNLFIK